MSKTPEIRSYNIHGTPVRLESIGNPFNGHLEQFLSPFTIAQTELGGARILGSIRPFDASEVARCVSPEARPVAGLDDLIELYSLGERYWLVDDRWGICEINLLKRHWRSWILPARALDWPHLIEAAVIWPMAQLLRSQGIHLAPAISVENNGWGALIIAPYGIANELTCLLRSGYRLIGQRWTAMRPAGTRVSLLNFPGLVETPAITTNRIDSFRHEPIWRDLCEEFPAHLSQRAWCQAVMVVAPGRRAVTRLRPASGNDAMELLRRAWPIIELPINRRVGDVAGILARDSACMTLELSRNTDDFVRLMEYMRLRKAKPKVQVSVSPAIANRSMKRPAIAAR